MADETLEVLETQERTPISVVREYLEVLRGEDLELYQAAQGMTDDVLHNNTSTSWSGESHTYYAINNLIDYQHRQTDKRLEVLNSSRKAAAVHVVRAMIQGNRFPIENFGEVIDEVLRTMALIDRGWHPTRSHRRWVREEILDTWPHASTRTARRAAEAYKFVGRPRKYGKMMVRVARLEKRAKH